MNVLFVTFTPCNIILWFILTFWCAGFWPASLISEMEGVQGDVFMFCQCDHPIHTDQFKNMQYVTSTGITQLAPNVLNNTVYF